MSNETTTEAIPFATLREMGTAIARSGLFGVKTPDQAIALMLVAQAEGLHPATAARDYHVIQGRPTLKSDAMLARFQAAGGKVEWLELNDTCVKAKFSHPQGGEVVIDWTIDRARKITSYDKETRKWKALTDKDNWKNYPRQMLRARVVSEGVRTVYPQVCCGVYTPEEVADFTNDPTPVLDGEGRAIGGEELKNQLSDRFEQSVESAPPAQGEEPEAPPAEEAPAEPEKPAHIARLEKVCEKYSIKDLQKRNWCRWAETKRRKAGDETARVKSVEEFTEQEVEMIINKADSMFGVKEDGK